MLWMTLLLFRALLNIIFNVKNVELSRKRDYKYMAIGKCLKCDKIAPMTEDHVFPKWLKKCLPNFKINIKDTSGVELLCAQCNGTKAGELDYSRVATREVVKEIVKKFAEEIRKHEEFNF